MDGRLSSLENEEYLDKVVLVDIWGTWCPPCRVAIPYLVELQNVYGDRGLVVVGIAIEAVEDKNKRVARLKKFVTKFEVNYPILDGGTTESIDQEDNTPRIENMLGIENFQGFPTTLLLARDGSLDLVEMGFSIDTLAMLERHIEKLLAEKTGSTR